MNSSRRIFSFDTKNWGMILIPALLLGVLLEAPSKHSRRDSNQPGSRERSFAPQADSL
jgi:hypothetical protein